MDVSIIIVNYNTKKMTSDCIDSIIQHTSGISYEIILVDNDSKDGSVDFFKRDKRVFFISSNKNLGFGKANNLGYKYSKGKYIFLLNSDTILLNNAIKYFFDYFENNKDKTIACLGGYLLNADQKIIHSLARFPQLGLYIKNILNIYTLFFKIDLLNKEYNNSVSLTEPYYITGADLFIKRDIIEKLGMFDEKFFMYYEETDMQKRYHNAGFNSMIIKGPKIIHFCGGSNKIKKKRTILAGSLSIYSSFIYAKKYFPIYQYYIIRILYFLLYRPKITIYPDSVKNKIKLISILIKSVNI